VGLNDLLNDGFSCHSSLHCFDKLNTRLCHE